MRKIKMQYTDNSFEELSKIIKKLKWKVLNSDGTEFDGNLSDGSYTSIELSDKSKSKINNEIPLNLIIKYEFNITKNIENKLLFFSYNITEIETIVNNDEINNNIELTEIKELIDVKFKSKSKLIIPEIFRRNRRKYAVGRNPGSYQEKNFEENYDSDTSFELMILLKLIKRIDKRLDDIENHIKSDSMKKLNNEKGDIEDKVLSVVEVSKLLGLAKSTIYSKVSRRELPHMKRGKILYFSEKEINEYIKSGKVLSNTEIDEISRNYIGNLKPNK
jgi:excisionase family DNA binding protein